MTDPYNLVVIGGGSAGLVSALIAAAVKAKVALIERDKMGGDCLNTGCVPSKALIKTARFVSEMNRHRELGVESVEYKLRFSRIMDRVHSIIQTIEPHDSVERFTGLGVECFQGDAEIIDRHTVRVGSDTLKTKNIIFAQGAEPFVPPIKGLDQVAFLTSDNLWELRELPNRLIVLGGGPIGCEMAQSFARLGSQVTQIESFSRILPREDPDVAEVIRQAFVHDGVSIMANTTANEVIPDPNGGYRLVCSSDGQRQEVPFDHILLAVGRRARSAGKDFSKLGVRLRPNGTVAVDSYMCANGKNIYAAGDITGPYQFTHMAAHQAYYACVNALFAPIKFKVDYRVVPWVTYTDPEVAQVGLNEQTAKEQGIRYEVVKYDLDDLDRAITESETKGFVKVLVKPGTKDGQILGATTVAHGAGEMNTEFILGMKHGFGLNKILGTIHPYPTMSEANKMAAGKWKKLQARGWIMSALEKFHRMRR